MVVRGRPGFDGYLAVYLHRLDMLYSEIGFFFVRLSLACSLRLEPCLLVCRRASDIKVGRLRPKSEGD